MPSIVFPSLITYSAFTRLFSTILWLRFVRKACFCEKTTELHLSINETDEVDKADQLDRIGKKMDTGKIAFSCHPNVICPSCLMPIVRHVSPSLTPSLTSQSAFANKVLIFINIVYES